MPVGFADEKNSLSTLKNPINTSMRTQPITFADIFSICIKIGRKTHKTPAETSAVRWTNNDVRSSRRLSTWMWPIPAPITSIP